MTGLRREISCFVSNKSSLKGDTPTVDLVLGYKQVSDLEVITIEIGRVGRSRLEEDPIIRRMQRACPKRCSYVAG